MTGINLRDSLIEYLIEASPMFEAEGLKNSDDLYDAGLDSLDMVNFLLSIEENLGIKISDDELHLIVMIDNFAFSEDLITCVSVNKPVKPPILYLPLIVEFNKSILILVQYELLSSPINNPKLYPSLVYNNYP